MELALNINTIVGLFVGGLVSLVAFMLRKWTSGLEKKLDVFDEKKMDIKLCESTHKALCQKFDTFKQTLDEVRKDVKDLSRSMSYVAKRGE